MATNGEFAESCRALYHHIRVSHSCLSDDADVSKSLSPISYYVIIVSFQHTSGYAEDYCARQNSWAAYRHMMGKCAAALCKLAISSHYYILVIISL